ncbi:MAG: hypothetical protein P4M08_10075 [Oligoflexia bacterium]|nr:hypothetical protein [Oligoflexia bacterium]
MKKHVNLARFSGAAIISAGALAFSGCNNNSTTGMLNSVSASISTSSTGDLIATIVTGLDTSSYGLAELNIPVVDPKNPSIQYGVINITPTVCSTSTCLNGGELNLTLDLSTIIHIESASTTLPNGTPFPILFSSPATTVYAAPVGSSGGKVYAAIGGGAYLIGAAIPFAGLTGPGSYTPGLDVFDAVKSSNITTYIGYFAGAPNTVDQTGVGVFVDLSSAINALAMRGGAAAARIEKSAQALGGTAKTSSAARPGNGSPEEEQLFLYNLWKNGEEKHPVLQYK